MSVSFFAALLPVASTIRSLPFARGLLNVVDCFLRLPLLRPRWNARQLSMDAAAQVTPGAVNSNVFDQFEIRDGSRQERPDGQFKIA
jgi:hypothetical protein